MFSKSKFYTLFKTVSCLSIVTVAGLLLNTNSASAQISSATITVNDSNSITIPTAATTAASPSTFCTGSSSTLSVTGGHLGSGTPTANWQWYEDACPTATATPIGSGTSISVSPTNPGLQPITKTYYVRAEGGYCNYTTACIPVTVTINPNPVLTAPSNQTFCAGTTTSAISVTGTPTGVTFDISGGASIGLANATGVTAIPAFTPSNSGTSPVTATITLTPVGCNGSAVTFTITVNPAATMDQVTSITKCNGNTVAQIDFTTQQTGGTVSYSWTNNNTNIGLAASGTGNIASFTATNTSTGASCADEVATITVTPTFTNNSTSCPGAPMTFTITVHPTPTATIAAVAPELCPGGIAQVTYTNICGASPFAIDIQENGTTTTQTATGVISGGTITINPQPTTLGQHQYNLIKITDNNGCTNPTTP